MDLWTEDIHLYEVVWTCGPVDLWTEDIHLYEVMWTCGPVDLWTCGPGRHNYLRRDLTGIQLFVFKNN